MSLSPRRRLQQPSTSSTSSNTDHAAIRHVPSFTSVASVQSSSISHLNGASNNSHSHNNSNNNSTLGKMIDAAAMGKHHVKWSHVLHYLKAQCIVKDNDADDDDDDDENDRNASDDDEDGDDNGNKMKGRRKNTTGTATGSRDHHHSQHQYPFDIPFQRYYTASPDLLNELAPNIHTGQSILRTTIAYGTVVPISILQALCYLGPSAISHIDTATGRILLHHVCRFPPFSSFSSTQQQQSRTTQTTPGTSLDMVFDLLIKAHPNALLHRDHNGCTPLHYLYMHHAPLRTATTTQLFLYNFSHNKHLFFTIRQPIHQNRTNENDNHHPTKKTVVTSSLASSLALPPPLPDIPRPTTQNKLPCHAAIIPDMTHGCIPLHYAVMYGAPYETIHTLIMAYPTGKHIVDRYNRTPLHYLLGTSILFVDRESNPTTITGEVLPSWNYDAGGNNHNHNNNNNNNYTNDDNKGITTTAIDTTEPTKTKKLSILQQQKLISNHYYYYHHPIDINILQLLLTSRVARTIDAIHQRCPLHCVAIYIAHQTFLVHNSDVVDDHTTMTNELMVLLQIVIDSYTKQCVCQDKYGMTPILLLFDTVQKLQYRIYMEQCYTHNTNSNVNGITTTIRRQLSNGYAPAIQLIQMLIQAPTCSVSASSSSLLLPNDSTSTGTASATLDDAGRIVAIEDNDGRIPIHIALQIVTPSEMIHLLVMAYPACLVHTTTNEMWCPLHTALCCNYTAHLQSIDTIRILLFHSYKTGKYGTTVDGRLAIKMEDAMGYYPIHYACQNQVASSIISLFVERYTNCCIQQTSNDDLPIHCIVQNLHPVLLQYILSDIIHSNDTNNNNQTNDENSDNSNEYVQELIIDVRVKLNVLLCPLVLSPDAKNKLIVADSIGGMLPLHIAILFQALDYTMMLKMLQLYPYAAMQYTNNLQSFLGLQPKPEQSVSEQKFDYKATPNINAYSAIDLHDICQQRQNHNTILNVYNDVEWYRIRELLFSFGPTLESHRHRQDLLDHGVQIIVDELLFHEQELDGMNEDDVNVTTGENTNDANENPPTKLLPGFHYTASNTLQSVIPTLEITHSVSAMEEELGIRPRVRRRRRRGNKVSRRLPSNKSRHHPSSNVSSGSHLNRTDTLPNGPTSGSDTLTSVDYGSKVVQLDMMHLKTNSSIYDDEDLRFIHDNDDDDDDEDGSYLSGEDGSSGNDESYMSEDDDDCGTEEYDTQDDSGTRGSMSQETTSRSRLRTTFEEDEEEDGTENDSEVDTASEDLTSRRGTTFDDGETGTTRSYDDESVSTTRSQSRQTGRSTFAASFSRRRGQTATNTTTVGTDSRRVTFDDESTGVSNGHKSFDMDNAVSSVGSYFDLPRGNPTSNEEKKDEGNDPNPELPSTPRTANRRKKTLVYQRPPYMSEVGMRIWTFFVMYCDLNNPKDNYADKLAAIVAAIKFSTWEELVSCPLPPYAKNYIKSDMDIDGLSFRDIASPKCRALIHKTSHFLGKYDFRSDHDILVYRTTRDDSVIVEASEWLYTTEAMTNAKNPGISEEKIWSTGEVPAEIGVTFETRQRPVWIKFTKNGSEYDNEIDCRVRLGVSIDDETVKGTGNDVIPILQHFNAISTERKHDQNYNKQRYDERFQSLNLINGCTEERKMQILLHEYPYVIVYPAPLRGTLYDYFLKHGLSQTSECKQILSQIVHALGFLHNNDISHGNICMRNIVSLDSNARDGLYWGFLNLSCASFTNKSSNQYLGGIDIHGFPLFETETLPPEMFMKVTATELNQYFAYWAVVQKRFHVTIDNSIINPYFDLRSASTYVVKCHFIPLTLGENDVTLPYDLVPASTSSDFWALGQLLFVLHTGRNLFQVSARDGRLYDYEGIYNWDGFSLIYEHVDDELVQDILLRCLSLREFRERLTATDLLHHPFFTGDHLSEKIREGRQLESAAHKRNLMKKLQDESEKQWLSEHSTTIYCWNFGILKRFNYSPSQIVKQMMYRKVDITTPCSAILLPYDPFDPFPENDNLVIAERIGIELLELGKVCHFCLKIKHAVDLATIENKNGWSLSELEKSLVFDPSQFSKILSKMSELASRHVEEFRRNPIKLAMTLITQQIENIYRCFEGRKLYFYLVDEYAFEPIAIANTQIPVSGSQRIELFTNVLPLTHLCLLYAMGVTNRLLCLSKLLLPNNESCVPDSWTLAAAGLNPSLSVDGLTEEVAIILKAQEQSNASKRCISDNVSMIRNYIVEVDPHRNIGGLQRVVVANTCLWTDRNGVVQLEDAARTYTLSDALLNCER